MKNKFTLPVIAAALGIMTISTAALAGPLETVGPTGTHADVQSAIAAVDLGGIVEIVDGGTTDTLTGSIDLSDGPATYTIRKAAALAATEITLTNGGDGLVTINDSGSLITSNKNVTIEGLTLQRTGGSGTVIDVDQSDPVNNAFTIDLTFNDCIIEHTGTALDENGEAIKIDDGFVGGALVTINANDTSFLVDGLKSENKAAIRVQDGTWENLNVNLTDCIVSSVNYRAIRNDGGDNQNWNLVRTTVEALTDRAFEFPNPHNNVNVTITDSTIRGGEEAIIVDEDGNGALNNVWTISGSTLETVGTTDNTIKLNYDIGNEFNLSNSVIISAEGTNTSNSRGVNLVGFDTSGTADQGIFIYNNTFLAAGTGGARAISGSANQINLWNNVFLNFLDASLLSGSYGGSAQGFDSDNNIIVGPADDTSRGSNGAYIVAAAGLANALTAAGLDANYKPLAGSPVLAAGATANPESTTKGDILAFIGNVDKDGTAREATPDIGAFELVTGSSVIDWLTY